MEEFDFGDDVDLTTFEQILEMDDEEDGDHEFSKSIVFGFLEQAESTFKKMDKAMCVPTSSCRSYCTDMNRDDENLTELSSLGHFLKGSSATLGFTKVKDECEKIQNYGAGKDETGLQDQPDKEKSLENIGSSLATAKEAFRVVDRLMRSYYNRLESA